MAESKGKQSRFDLIIGAVDKFSGVFKGFNAKVAQSNAQLNRLQKSVSSLDKAMGFNRLRGAAMGVAGSMGNVASEGKALVGTLAGLAAKTSLLFGAAGGGVFALAKNTADAGDAAVKSAQRAGVGIEVWQEYAYAAKLADLSQEQLIKGFGGLQDAAKKAAGGDKAKTSIFKTLGIDPKTAKGEVKRADSLFMEISDKIKALQAQGKGADAVNLLGDLMGDREARPFIPLLSAGSEGLLEMRKRAHELGLVFSDEAGKEAEAFNDGLAEMGESFAGIGYSIGKQILPPLTKLIAKFTEWAAANREVISTKFAEWMKKLGTIDEIWAKIESGFSTLGRLASTVSSLAQAFGGWGNVLIAVAAIISGKFLLSMGSLIASFGKLGLAIMTTPVGWLLAACAAIGAAAYIIYRNWDGIVAYFKGLWQGVQSAFDHSWVNGILTVLSMFDPVQLILKGMNSLVAYFTGVNLAQSGAKLVDSFGLGFSEGWDRLMGWFAGKLKVFTGLWADIKGFFGFGDDEASISLNDNSGAYQPATATPLNMGGSAKAVSESRTEHVERQENTVKLIPPDGWGMQVSGPGSGVQQNGTSMQLGYQAYGF